MDRDEQLIKKDCKTGEYYRLYPVTKLANIIDTETGDNIKDIVESINHFYLPFIDGSRIMTRRQVPPKYRRKGLWITYVTCHGTIVTEYYNNNVYTDDEWSNKDNWVQYETFKDVSDLINSINSTLVELVNSIGKPDGIAQLDSEGKIPLDNLPEIPDSYELPIATETTLGGVKMSVGKATLGTTFFVTNPEKPSVTIPNASTTYSGLLSSQDKIAHDSFFKTKANGESWFQHFTNLSIISDIAQPEGLEDKVIIDIETTTGEVHRASQLEIPAVTTETAGVMTPTDKLKLDSLKQSGNDSYVLNITSTIDSGSFTFSNNIQELFKAVRDKRCLVVNLNDASAVIPTFYRILGNTLFIEFQAEDLTSVSLLEISNTSNTGTASFTPIYDSATPTKEGLMSAEDKAKLDSISEGAGNYTLTIATPTDLGGVKVGYVGKAGTKNYGVKLDTEGKMYVEVPWTDTTYSVATTEANGLMSSADKAKIDSIVAGRILTQAQFNALEIKDPNMVYYIKG